MKFDSWGCIITEESDPGCLGDSAHETARYAVLGGTLKPGTLKQFVSASGFLRHPNAPYGPPRALESWRESDATSDFVFPLLMACDLTDPETAIEIRARLRSTWTVAPGHIASPALMALVYKRLWLMKLLTDAQTLIFNIPWRWSDDGRFKGRFWKVERTTGSSADYLNYFISIYYLRRFGYRVKFDRDLVMAKVRAYYEPRPASDWIVELYRNRLAPLNLPRGVKGE